MKFIWRFHDWYDKQPEPGRLLIMLLLASPVITVGLWVNTPAKALGFLAYLVVMLGSRIYRKHAKVKP